MIGGRYVLGRPLVSGLLQFATVPKFEQALVSVRFLIDSGADATLVQPVDYEPEGPTYAALRKFPLAEATRGFGGVIEARRVPVALYLRHEDGHYDRIELEAEIAKPAPESEGLPSVLGRDVIDLYKLTMDRSHGFIGLESADGQTDPWPDEAAAETP
jgi:hypothetical protein